MVICLQGDTVLFHLFVAWNCWKVSSQVVCWWKYSIEFKHIQWLPVFYWFSQNSLSWLYISRQITELIFMSWFFSLWEFLQYIIYVLKLKKMKTLSVWQQWWKWYDHNCEQFSKRVSNVIQKKTLWYLGSINRVQ